MKRSGRLQRRTPLQPGQKGRRKAATPLRRAPLQRTRGHPVRRPKDATDYGQLRMQTMWRAGGACQARVPGLCAGRGQQAHHLLPRSAGGPDDLDNLAWVCGPCHEWLHSHPTASYAMGLLRRRGDAGPYPWHPDDHRPAWRPRHER